MRAIRLLLVAGAALVFISAGIASAEVPPPFSAHPSDTGLAIRLDFARLKTCPNLGRMEGQLTGGDPNYKNALVLQMLVDRRDPPAFHQKQFPGEIVIFEFGVGAADLEKAFAGEGGFQGDAAEQALATSALAVGYGRVDTARLIPFLRELTYSEAGQYNGLTYFRHSKGEGFVTMLNGWTILAAATEDALKAGIDAGMGVRVSLAKTGGELLKDASAPFFFAAALTPSMMRKLAEASENPPPGAMVVAGLPAFLQETKNLRAVTACLTDSLMTIDLKVGLLYADDGSADRGSESLNQMMSGVKIAARSRIQQPGVSLDASRQVFMDQLQRVEFVPKGPVTRAEFGLPAGVFQQSALNGLTRARENSRARACAQNLRRLQAAKSEWLKSSNSVSGGEPAIEELVGITPELDYTPICPSGGSYIVGDAFTPPSCSVPGHGIAGR
ncbi:hypothetical protein HZA57_09885 [Candidatus Poribacteria bacterium]|nr:hypothetical protein [Candidatus Poribacteria bacterium]